MNVRPFLTLLLTLPLLGVCRPPLPDDAHPAGAIALDAFGGPWLVQIEVRGEPPARWPWANSLEVPLHLGTQLTRDSLGATVACPGCLVGTAEIPPTIRAVPATFLPTVTGFLDHEGRFSLRIGGCCDRGEWELTGQLRGEAADGRWRQTFLSNDRNAAGTFRLVRPSSRASAT